MPHDSEPLVNATLLVAHHLGEINEQLRTANNNNAILQKLAEMKGDIMSAISDFGDKVSTAFDKLGAAVDGVATDVDFLKAEIKKLQDNPGPITAADQAILDGVQSRLDGLATKVAALDAATEEPPTPTP